MVEHNLSLGIDPKGAKSGGQKFRGELSQIRGDAIKTETTVDKMGRNAAVSMNKGTVGAKSFALAMGRAKIAAVALGAAVGAAAIAGFQSARGLNGALAEASTLIEGTAGEMSLMRKEARAMASEFGGGTTAQVEAFYQAISAGAGSVEEATTLLQTSNLLAKGGVTDITTSVDILTTAVNAYAGSGLTAAQASDLLFTGVKFGKTTVEELASSLGRAAPLAGKLGVGFDELVAATAALTKGGVSTAEAVTGVRGVLAAVLKPTEEAKQAAEDLGLEFNSAALESKGFVGFLQSVIDETGGSSDALAQLFGGMEGLTGVLGLATNGGAAFNEAMAEMRNSLGATQEAADKVSGSLSDRLDVSLGKIGLAAEWLGGILLNIAVPALEAIVWAVEGVIAGVKTLGQDVAAVFRFFSKEVVKTANTTIDWTDAVDIHTQAEFDLEFALGEVTGANTAASAAAIVSANANLDAANAAYDAAAGEIAYAKALVARQTVEVNAQAALADTGMNFFSPQLQAQAQTDFDNASAFLAEAESHIAEASAGVRAAFVGVDQAASYDQGGPTVWNPFRKEPIEETSDAVLELDEAVTRLGSNGATAVAELNLATEAAGFSFENLGDIVADGIGNGLMDIVSGTKTVGEAFRSMALTIAKQLFDVIVVQRIVLALKNAISGFGGGGGAVTSGVTGAPIARPFANGGVFSGGNVTAFADGGVVSSPTLFPMASGVGLMGEAGPEAIMPLSRGSDGKLGVKASSGGGQSSGGDGGVDIYNYFDIDAAMEAYVDSPNGRRKIMNMVGEEQAA